jgi:Flp pilus assembly CpaE family ATPase
MTNPYRVLLVEANQASARMVQEMLAEERGAFVLEIVESLALALQRLNRSGIDIILADLHLPDSRDMNTFHRLHAQSPNLPIVILSGLDDESQAILAVSQGAQDYLVRQKIKAPVLARVLRYAILRKKAQPQQQTPQPGEGSRSGKTLAFIGAKGGTGTTTVALNVAFSLAKQKRSVVVAELRPSFGSAAEYLHLSPAADLSLILDLDPEGLDEKDLGSLLAKAPLGVRILFGPQKMSEYREITEAHAEVVIRSLSCLADFLILDLPSQPTPANKAAARLSQFVGVVVDREPGCMAPAKMYLDHLRVWGLTGSLVGIVVVNRAALTIPMKMLDIRQQLGSEIVGVIPPAADACVRAQDAGSPLIISQPDTPASASIWDMTQRLIPDQVVPMRF